MQVFIDFLKKYPVKSYAKGHIILHEGDVPPYAYVIKSGYVKTYEITSGGEEKPINFDGELEAFPVVWIFEHAPAATYFYEALSDCEVYQVPRQDYLAFLRGDARVQLLLFKDFVKQTTRLQMRVYALEQLHARDKVFHTIRFLASRFGSVSETTAEEWQIHIPLTQQDIANFIGLTRETTALELKKLEREGVIRYDKQSYAVNRAKFDAMLATK